MEPADDMQLEVCAGEGHSWASAAVALDQDVAGALQLQDNQESDIAVLETLCSRALKTCQAAAAAAAGCHPTATPMQALPCLTQLSSSTMQLAAAVFCQPDTALQLLTAGTYAAAAEQLKAAVKELITLLVKAVGAAAGAADTAGADAGGASDSSSAAQAFLQGLLPAAQAAAQQLLHMGKAVAGFIANTPSAATFGSGSGPGSSSPVPKEMRSMAVLSLSWTNLTKLLMAVPPHARAQVLQPESVLQGLRCALMQLQRAVREMPQQAPEKREVVARFWMQNVSRLTGSVSCERAAHGALETLLEVALEVFECGSFPRDDMVGVQDFLQGVLQPRLVLCLASLLSSSAEDASATQQKLDLLLNFTHNRTDHAQAAAAIASADDLLQVQLHLLVLLDLMQQLPSLAFAPVELLQQASCKLLSWALHAAGCSLCPVVLADDAGGALLQHTLQCCLAFVLGCMAGLGQQGQQELLALLTRMSLSEHPVLAFLSQQLLAEALACGSEELLLVQLSGLLQLLQAAAACAALPGVDSAFNSGTQALVDTMSAVLQACDEATASSWVSQHLLQLTSPAGSSDGSSNSWLDAGSCCLLACQCSLLQRLGQRVLQGSSQPPLREHLSQLWLTAQQVLELLAPERQQHAGSLEQAAVDAAGCEQLLVLHQLAWQLQAMQALLQLQAAHGASSATQDSSPQCYAAFALDLLKAIHSSSNKRPSSANAADTDPCNADGSTATTQATAAARTACTAAALKVLAACGQVPVQEGAEELLQLLQGIATQHEPLHALLAAVCGSIGVPAGNLKHEALFQQLLASPHWPVRHAAFDGLLARLRHNSYSGSNIVRLLPPCMRVSVTEASPAVVQVVKAHLQRQPDAQAQQAFQAAYPQLAEQHSQVLAAALNNSAGTYASAASDAASDGDNSSTSKLCDTAAAATALAQLERALAAAGSNTTAAGAGAAATASQVGLTGAAGGACGDGSAAAAVGPVQALLQLAATAGSGLEAVDKALCLAESEVRLLLSAASAAAHGHQLGGEEVVLLSRQGARLAGGCASLCSRLRALQDQLACLK